MLTIDPDGLKRGMNKFSDSVEDFKGRIEGTLSKVKNLAADYLEESDFLSRTIGMSNSYDTLMYFVQSLGREPVSLLGKDFPFIFDHVRRNYRNGMVEQSKMYNRIDCPRFTFYKKEDVPTVFFVNPYEDSLNFDGKWEPSVDFGFTQSENRTVVYSEAHDGTSDNIWVDVSDTDGTAHGTYVSFNRDLNWFLPSCDLLKKTNEQFNRGKNNTLIARFYTNTEFSRSLSDPTQTAVSSIYGMSHGRNLRKLVPDYSQGYKNPYCRVWTYHHEYRKIENLIRPFGDQYSDPNHSKHGYDSNGTPSFRTSKNSFYGFDDDGDVRLNKLGVLNYDNGMVRIAPTAKISDYFNNEVDNGKGQNAAYSPKRCMFSIENLAWKDTNNVRGQFDAYGLSAEQKGPLGGRIMWFPPYNLSFSEEVSVDWNENKFIGRGERLYTYSNTDRRGSLQFTLLIDHPGLIDYWNRPSEKTGGLNSNGTASGTLNGGRIKDGVDDLNSDEQTLLRFFAGCDILSVKNQTYQFNTPTVVTPEPDKDEEEQQPITPSENQDATEPPSNGRIVCFLYYPNNYSGVDDAPTKSGVVNAVDYLMNGVGAQKGVLKTNSGVPASDFSVMTNVKPSYGGYEVRKNANVGISNATSNANFETVKSSIESNGNEWMTSGTGAKIQVSYGSQAYYLTKLVGGLAQSKSQLTRSMVNRRSKNVAGECYFSRRWWYRVDKEWSNDLLNFSDSYLDIGSLGLNGSSGYTQVLKSLPSFIDDFDENDNTKLVSFTDFYVALMGDVVKSSTVQNNFDQENVSLIRDIKNNQDKYTITSIKFQGHASKQGWLKQNKKLANNRRNTLRNWFQAKGFRTDANYTDLDEHIEDPNKSNVDYGSNNKLKTKLWRSACVIIDYALASNDVVQDAQSTKDVDKISVPNGTDTSTTTAWRQESDIIADNGMKMSMVQESVADSKWKQLNESLEARNKALYERSIADLNDQFKLSMKAFNGEDGDDKNDANNGYNVGTVKRYDNEGEFFKEVGRTDNFLRHLISEKVKYFDPAFHSISPEGFNARLTFLHQCTRQGSTVNSSAMESSTAYNLAFGRPPVCVLRVGDFYYTKIIIRGISIQYETPQWDLNPEGIGVMPMFANITIQFNFIGGSDLGGPIARLQNAVSFNYYANASVYDNRAESVEYDPNGSGREIKFKPFTYPNTVGQSIGTGNEYGSSGSYKVVRDKNGKYVREWQYKGDDKGMYSDL